MAEVTLTPLPFEEAIAAFRDRVPLSDAEFKRLADDARTQAFAVAGVAREDAAAALYVHTLDAIEQGVSGDEWRRRAAKLLEEKGYEGADDWALQLAFRNQVQSAYAAGRWAQVQRVSATRPYLQYDAVEDKRTRPTHAAMDGRVFRFDDPLWSTWYPPNGHNCRCSVRTLSARQVEARGLTVETAEDVRLLEFEGRSYQLVPDPGWTQNVGRRTWGDGLVMRVVDELAATGGRTAATVDADQARRALGLAEGATSRVLADASGGPVVVGVDALAVAGDVTAAELAAVERLVTDPAEVWMDVLRRDDGSVRIRRHYARGGQAAEVVRTCWTGFQRAFNAAELGSAAVRVLTRS